MNEILQTFSRHWLKSSLSKLPERSQEIFKLMYGRAINLRGDADRTAEEAKAMSINAVVDEMEDHKLDHAMFQVQNTLDKNNA